MFQSISEFFQSKQKSAKNSNANSYFCGVGRPVWIDKNYFEFANEAYIKNVIVHRSINMIAHAAAGIPLKLFEHRNRSKVALAENHPLLQLLSRPNPLQSGQEFMESVYIYRQIAGNAYLLAIDDSNSEIPEIDNPVHELHIIRPDRVQVIAGENLMPLGYRYILGNATFEYPIDPVTGVSRILHIKNFHPLSDWYGLAPVEAALLYISQHNQANAWNQAFLQNGARPSGIVKVKDSEGKGIVLDDEQFTKLQRNLQDTLCSPANAGKLILLDAGIEFQELSKSHEEMQYNVMEQNLTRHISLAMGVPPQLLGIPGDNTYSNLVEARVALWEQTVLPLVRNTIDHLNRWLVPRFGKNLELSYDIDAVGALANRTDALWDRLEKSNFLTNDEKRRIAKLGDC